MQPEARKLLLDIRMSLDDISEFTTDMSLAEYKADAKCKAAVERKFEIIGEACTRLRDRHPEIFAGLTEAPRIIGFRNRLIHGYDSVDDAIVWDVLRFKLPILAGQLTTLMAE